MSHTSSSISFKPATRPTLYFIGVTTAQSSIMKVFPAWARHLGLQDAEIRGIDFPVGADSAAYREAVAYIKDDPLSMGALVTTHKIDLFNACKDMFNEIDTFASLMGETSCLSKRDGRLICHAKDPISSGLTIDGFLGQNYFAQSDAEVFSIGAGGSSIALTWYLMRRERGLDVPSRIVISDRSEDRLSEIRRIHADMDSTVTVEYRLANTVSDNDALLLAMKPQSLVINATGLGKDAPGSPLSLDAVFPMDAIVWDLNYRGELIYLEQARTQAEARNLTVHDGWNYFIHGWTQVIAEVFDIGMDTSPANINLLTEIALQATRENTAITL